MGGLCEIWREWEGVETESKGWGVETKSKGRGRGD